MAQQQFKPDTKVIALTVASPTITIDEAYLKSKAQILESELKKLHEVLDSSTTHWTKKAHSLAGSEKVTDWVHMSHHISHTCAILKNLRYDANKPEHNTVLKRAALGVSQYLEEFAVLESRIQADSYNSISAGMKLQSIVSLKKIQSALAEFNNDVLLQLPGSTQPLNLRPTKLPHRHHRSQN